MTFRRNIRPYNLQVAAVYFNETLLPTYWIIQSHKTKGHNIIFTTIKIPHLTSDTEFSEIPAVTTLDLLVVEICD